MHEIQPWQSMADRYKDTILLGNGASIAVDRRFAYVSLLDFARDKNLLAASVEQLFKHFYTADFELILRIIWQATHVNKALCIRDDQTHNAYVEVRDSLIRVVRAIHPSHEEVRDRIPAMWSFLNRFDTVLSLNYDLIVYWVMTSGLEDVGGHRFKDCFNGAVFDEDWNRLRTPIKGATSTTLVFHPHGSLYLCRNLVESELKIRAGGEALLDKILSEWQEEKVVPLFVSEGTAEQKISSIRGSYYLSTVYREVLADDRKSLVIYGWGFGEHDRHLLKRMRSSGIERVAVSVYGADQGFCNKAATCIHEDLGGVQVEFFDSQSPGCWTQPPA